MPLVRCKDCGGKVSKAARSCPHCGKPRRSSSPISSGLRIVTLLIAVGMALGAVVTLDNPNESTIGLAAGAIVFFVLFLTTLVSRVA